MIDIQSNIQPKPINEVRKSRIGRTMTDGQLKEAMAITNICRNTICKSGTFTEKLTDYAHAFARTERFDAIRGETIIRDVFEARYGQNMNQMLEGFKEREANLPKNATRIALDHARGVGSLISDAETMPFYLAYDIEGRNCAHTLGITEVSAKDLMKTAFRNAEKQELYEWGKALEKEHHLPVREAARAEYATTARSKSASKSVSKAAKPARAAKPRARA